MAAPPSPPPFARLSDAQGRAKTTSPARPGSPTAGAARFWLTSAIGTIDQALLGVLPTKFSTLRLYALSSKILIVDEVHELGEPYMQEELTQLLHAHAMRGGSAILLTATLPLAQRQRLVDAFESGAGRGSTA